MGIGVIIIFIFMLTLDLVTYREIAGTMEVSEIPAALKNTFLLDGCKLALIGNGILSIVNLPSAARSSMYSELSSANSVIKKSFIAD